MSKDVDVMEAKAALRMADREWANNGLLATDPRSDGANLEAIQYLDAFRGEYPVSVDGAVERVDQMVGNLIFSLVNTMISQVSARSPKPIVRPSGGTAASEDAQRRAWLNEKIIQAQSLEGKYKRQVDRAILSSCLLPFGGVRHGFTPDIEEYEKNGVIHTRFKNESPVAPWIRFMRPWQVRIDPLVDNFDMDGEPRWIAFHNLYTRAQINANPDLIMRHDWEPTAWEDLRPMHERKKPTVAHSGEMAGAPKKSDPNRMALYEEWVVYDASTRMMYGVSPGSDKLVREQQEWPIDTGQLPFSILTMNEQLDSPFGIPFPRMIWSEQMMYNKIWTILNAIVERTRQVFITNESAFSGNEEELEKLTNPGSLVEFVVATSNAAEAMAAFPGATIDGQLVGLLFQLKEAMREVLGISSFDRGQRANVETASEAQQIGAGSAANRSRIQARVEDFWTDIYRYTHRALLQANDPRRFVVPIVGEDNAAFLTAGEVADGFVTASAADLQGEFVYGIQSGSTLPHDPSAEFNALHTAVQAAGGPNDPLLQPVNIRRRLMELSGNDPEKMVISQEQAVQMGQNNPEGAPPQNQSTPEPSAGVPNAPNIPGDTA